MGSDDLFKKRKLKRRQALKSIAPDRFLIVCEGVKTEPNYFAVFKEKIRETHRDSVSIEIVGEGKNTESLIASAIRLMNRANPDYSQVWCVFDKDDFSDLQFNPACEMASAYNINIAYSVESFELWYVLHFEFMQFALQRDQYIKKLKIYLGSYEKNDPQIFNKIMDAGGNQRQAVAFSKRLEEQQAEKIFSQRNPSTTVYRLVEELNKYIEC